MIVDDGGGGGLPYPDGDPDAIRAAASRLIAVGHEVASAAGTAKSAAQQALSGWAGQAAGVFSTVSGDVQSGLKTVEDSHSTTGTLLRGFAETLTEMQAKAKAAQTAADNALDSLGRTLQATSAAATAASTSLASDAAQQLAKAHSDASKAQDDYNATLAAQTKVATDAFNAVQQAGAAVAAKLHGISDTLKGLDYHGAADAFNSVPTAFQGLAAVAAKEAFSDLADIRSALKSGDADKLIDAAESSYKDVADTVAKFGEDSPEALESWIRFRYGALSDAASDGLKAITGFDDLPAAAGLARNLSILGKVGLGAGALGDVLTLTDSHASGVDKGLSGLNLAGTGMAALSYASEGGLVEGLIGAQALDVVPGVGEVVIGVTGAVMAGKFIYDHWDAISNGIETLNADEVKAVKFVGGETLQLAEDEGQVVVSAGKDAVAAGQTVLHGTEAAVDAAGSVASGAVSDAANLGSKAVSGGKKLLSDINPF